MGKLFKNITKIKLGAKLKNKSAAIYLSLGIAAAALGSLLDGCQKRRAKRKIRRYLTGLSSAVKAADGILAKI